MKSIVALLLLPCLASTALAMATSKPHHPRKSSKHELGPAKYFHEPGGDEELGHYDARYFQGPVDYDEHLVNLRLLIRSYLTVFRAIGVDTWLAHGTLLGWWWNGQIMPWDYDLDTQVTASSLAYLGAHYNGTVHEYHYADADAGAAPGSGAAPPARRTKAYLLDVNPNHAARGRGNGNNVIDARWIDTSTGMFIDITGLAERDAARAPGVWACKNNHRYRTTQLYPMRETEFEGVPALVPYSFDMILVEEYGKKALVTTEFQGHEWDPSVKLWVKQIA